MARRRKGRQYYKGIWFSLGMVASAAVVLTVLVAYCLLFPQPAAVTPFNMPSGEYVTRTAPVVAVLVDDENNILGAKVLSVTVTFYPGGSGIISWAVPPCGGEDAQGTLLAARQAAERHTNRSLGEVDICVRFVAETRLVKGNSAGAALAVAMVAAIENKRVDNSYVVSAAVTGGGELLPVGEPRLKWGAVDNAHLVFVVSSRQGGLEGLDVVRVGDVEELAQLVLV